ncbi:MAG TPA: flagellar basal body-associated FliL family protein [Candidatus Nanopelagicaceae bacterium]|nr:flagellar basal body-associated FliL family protein [Candidatus Nanopelagicaceae bacterium]
MRKQKMEEKPPADEGEGRKTKVKRKLVILAGAVIVAIALAGYLMVGGSTAQAKPAPKPGNVVKLDSIFLNLSDGHYLKLGMALQETTDVTADVDGSQALDAAIELFSRVSMAQLNNADQRDAIKKQLISKIESIYPDKVMDVYYTEFVMQ